MFLNTSIFFYLKKQNKIMNNIKDWKWKATKIGQTGEHTEEIGYEDLASLKLSGGFMLMIKRMKIGEEIFYNEMNIKFLRIE